MNYDWPAIIGARLEDGVLTLRIDRSILSTDLDAKDAVRQIRFSEIDYSGDTQSWIGRPAEYEEFAQDDGSVLVQLYIDYMDDYVELRCSSVEEADAPYSHEDLVGKIRGLARAATSYSEAYEGASKDLSDLRQRFEAIAREVEEEIYRDRRKAEFFEESQPDRKRALEATVRFLTTLRSKLEWRK